jgi:hypothetical protein
MNIVDSNKPVFRTVMDIYSSLSENLCPSTHPITVLHHSVITQTASFSNCTHTTVQSFIQEMQVILENSAGMSHGNGYT